MDYAFGAAPGRGSEEAGVAGIAVVVPEGDTWRLARRRRCIVLACAAIIAIVVIGVACVGVDEVMDPSRYIHHAPMAYGEGFAAMLARADRLVVVDGGFDCCGPGDGGEVLVEITDQSELLDFARHVRFTPGTFTNSIDESCMCCGGPRLDWYRGRKRIALTALQHGREIRWKGFTTARILGVRIGYGDSPLTETSARWLATFLSNRSGHDLSLEPGPARRLAMLESETARRDAGLPQDMNQAELDVAPLAVAVLSHDESNALDAALKEIAPRTFADRRELFSWVETRLFESLMTGSATDDQWAAYCNLRARHRVWWVDRGQSAFQLLASERSAILARALGGDERATQLVDIALEWSRHVGDVLWSCCDEADLRTIALVRSSFVSMSGRVGDAARTGNQDAEALARRLEAAGTAFDAWFADCRTACP